MPEQSLFFTVGRDSQINNMFESWGWAETNLISEADLVQFPGGADVTPSLYGHKEHPLTKFNPRRDELWTAIYKHARKLGKPIAGICGGGQFLNVMCGGKMWQDVDGHALGSKTHPIFDLQTGEEIEVTSTHHQMMIPNGKTAVRIASAKAGSWREIVTKDSAVKRVPFANSYYPNDDEVLFYPAEKVLCFQPHPEYEHEPTELLYMSYLQEFLLPKEIK